MNREQANALRANMGLPPMPTVDQAARQAQKRRQAANKAAHAQLQRDIKSNRSKNKGK